MASYLEGWKNSSPIWFYSMYFTGLIKIISLNLCMKLQMLKTITFWLNVLHSILVMYILLTEQGEGEKKYNLYLHVTKWSKV